MIGLKNPSAPVQEQGKQRRRQRRQRSAYRIQEATRRVPYAAAPWPLVSSPMRPTAASRRKEQEQMRRTGRAKEGNVLEGVCIGADDQGVFCRGYGLVCEIAKARGFLCKNVIRARQSLHGVPRVQFGVVLYKFVTADKLEG